MVATLVLLETMDENYKLQVQAEPSARDIMKTLERQYANATASNKRRVLSQFLRFVKEDGDTFNLHVGKLK